MVGGAIHGVGVARVRGSQGAVPRLVFGQNVLAAAELLPQVGHLLSERGVLFLQESRADGDLVLLEPASIARAFRRDVVLSATRPVSVVLHGDGVSVWHLRQYRV